MPTKRILGLLAILVALLLAYAWIDGGEESLRPIAQPVSAPTDPSAVLPEPAP